MRGTSRSTIAGLAAASWLLAALGCKSESGTSHSSDAPPRASRSQPAAPAPTSTSRVAPTPNSLWAAGTPTFVTGTTGSDAQRQRLRNQVELVRGLVAPESSVQPDTSISPAQGLEGWPPHPVLYGRPDENAATQALLSELPLQLSATVIEVGGERFEGEGLRLVTAIPGREPSDERPGRPSVLLYAGTGPAGIAEINAGMAGDAPILIADRFGPLRKGDWSRSDTGELRASLRPATARRIDYRKIDESLSTTSGESATLSFYFPAMVERAANEAELIAACRAGIAQAVAKLGIDAPVDLSIYVYPDPRSKAELTGNGGHGHAVPSSRALHVLSFDPAALRSLVAHEATHVLAYFEFGAPALPLMGEGLAVWVSGQYAGRPLEEWRETLVEAPRVSELVGPSWLAQAEASKYPLAGLLVDALLREVGMAQFARALYTASAQSWEPQLRSLGIRAERLDALVSTAPPSPPTSRESR